MQSALQFSSLSPPPFCSPHLHFRIFKLIEVQILSPKGCFSLLLKYVHLFAKLWRALHFQPCSTKGNRGSDAGGTRNHAAPTTAQTPCRCLSAGRWGALLLTQQPAAPLVGTTAGLGPGPASLLPFLPLAEWPRLSPGASLQPCHGWRRKFFPSFISSHPELLFIVFLLHWFLNFTFQPRACFIPCALLELKRWIIIISQRVCFSLQLVAQSHFWEGANLHFWPWELPCLLCIRVNPAWSFEESHCRMSPTLTGRGVRSTPGLQWWWDVSCHSALLALPREPSPACGQVPACFMHCSNCSAGSYQGKQLSHKQVTWLSWAWLKCLLLLGLGENKPDLCPDAGKGAWSILVCKLIHQAGFHSGIAFHGRITNMMPERKGKGAVVWEEKIYLI